MCIFLTLWHHLSAEGEKANASRELESEWDKMRGSQAAKAGEGFWLWSPLWRGVVCHPHHLSTGSLSYSHSWKVHAHCSVFSHTPCSLSSSFYITLSVQSIHLETYFQQGCNRGDMGGGWRGGEAGFGMQWGSKSLEVGGMKKRVHG